MKVLFDVNGSINTSECQAAMLDSNTVGIITSNNKRTSMSVDRFKQACAAAIKNDQVWDARLAAGAFTSDYAAALTPPAESAPAPAPAPAPSI